MRREPHADVDGLFARIEHGTAHRNRLFALGLVLALAVSVSAGFLVARGDDGGDPSVSAALRADKDGKRDTATYDLGPLRQLAQRVAPGDVTVSTYAAGGDTPEACTADCRPPACRAVGSTVAELSNAAAVGIGVAPRYVAPPVSFVTAVGSFGEAEGSRANWWIVQAGANAPGAVSARAIFGNAVDEVPLVEGIAVIVLPGGPADGKVDFVTSGGVVLQSVALRGEANDIGGAAACAPQQTEPPTTTAPPGVQGNASDDVKLAVADAYRQALSGSNTVEQRRAAMEDAENIAGTLDAARAKYAGDIDHMVVTVSSVQMIDDTHASVQFRLDVGGSAYTRPGGAVFTDGRWKVTRSTICDIVTMAGVQCP